MGEHGRDQDCTGELRRSHLSTGEHRRAWGRYDMMGNYMFGFCENLQLETTDIHKLLKVILCIIFAFLLLIP